MTEKIEVRALGLGSIGERFAFRSSIAEIGEILSRAGQELNLWQLG